MSTTDESTSTETVEDQASETTEETPTEETPTEETPKEEEIPAEVLRRKLTEANAEAANYRTRLREAEAKLSEAKTPEDIEAAIAEFKQRNAELERQVALTTVARKYDLPDELAALLKGDTAEEMEAVAKSLQKFVKPAPTPESLSGGLDPASDEDDFDMTAAVRKARTRRF